MRNPKAFTALKTFIDWRDDQHARGKLHLITLKDQELFAVRNEVTIDEMEAQLEFLPTEEQWSFSAYKSQTTI